jgi:hypothetical protein
MPQHGVSMTPSPSSKYYYLSSGATSLWIQNTNHTRTGKILYGMGNLLEAQGRFDDSFNFHFRCLNQFRKVLGLNHHRVGDIYHRIAGHYMRQGLHKESEYITHSDISNPVLTDIFRGYLNSALKIFSARSYLTNERARTTFKKGKLLQLMGQVTESNKLLLEAYGIRKQLRPYDMRPLDKLEESDFDELVAYWSR